MAAPPMPLPAGALPMAGMSLTEPNEFMQCIAQMLQFFLPPQPTNQGYGFGYRTASIKEELKRLNVVLEPMLIGMLRNELDPLNLDGIPLMITDDLKYQEDYLELSPKLPGATPSMGAATMMRSKETTRRGTTSKWDLSFMMDGEVARQPEGVRRIMLNMTHISAAFYLHIAMVTAAALDAAGLERRPGSLDRTLTAQTYEFKTVEHNNKVASPYKHIYGFNTMLMDEMKQMQDVCGQFPDKALIPKEKEPVFLTNSQMVKYSRGGRTAEQKFWRDQSIIGTLHDVLFMATPQPPNTVQSSYQLNRQMTAANYAALFKRPDQLRAIWNLYNTNSDEMVPITISAAMKKLPFYEEPNLGNADLAATFKWTFVTMFAQLTCLDLGDSTNIQTALRGIGVSFRDAAGGAWKALVTAEFDRILVTGFASILTRVYDKGSNATLRAQTDDRIIPDAVTANDAVALQKHLQVVTTERRVEDTFTVDFNQRAAHIIRRLAGSALSTQQQSALMIVMAELLQNNVEFFRALSRSMVTGRKRSQLTVLNRSIFLILLGDLHDPQTAEETVICNMEAFRTRLPSMAYAKNAETYYTSLANGGIVIKPGVMMFCEESIADTTKILYLRLFERHNMQRMILFVSGINTGFATMSKPVMSTTEDSVTFVNYYHVSRRCGAFIRDPSRVKTLLDQFYNGYVSGGTTGIMTLKEMDDLASARFEFKSPGQNSAILIPVPMDSQIGGPFVNVLAKIDGTNTKPEESYPFLHFWKSTWKLAQAPTETMDSHSYKGQMCKNAFRTTLQYTNVSGKTVTEYGATCHGKYGELPGAKLVRTTGKMMYPKATEDT